MIEISIKFEPGNGWRWTVKTAEGIPATGVAKSFEIAQKDIREVLKDASK